VAGVAGIVLAGGAGRRMGGLDKALVRVGGVALLDRVLAAARPVCDRLVVVGPARPTTVTGVTFVQEAEPGGGPAPAVAAGLAAVPDAEIVLVLAADLPLLEPHHLRTLLAALAAGARAAALLPPDVIAVDLGRATFNVNRPEDLAAAERSVAAAADPE
jgi:molybdopterin-guanine dinucleotide biosynthesis protein A